MQNNYDMDYVSQNTPMYLFDIFKVQDRINYLREKLPTAKICYAVKANTFIAGRIADMADRLEICSSGEYYICEKLGIAPEKYVISGVKKEKDFIDQTVSSNEKVGCYTVESQLHFEMLFNAAKKTGRKLNLLLRLTSGNQFGMEESEIEQLISENKDSEFIKIIGIQYFSGTQKTSVKKLKRELEYVDGFLAKLQEDLGFVCEELEYGPGLPAMYFEEDYFEEEAYLETFHELLGNLKFQGEVILELGRGLAACCGTYFTKVVDKKTNKKENYAITDGGMHQLVYYGQFMAMKHPKMSVFPKRDGETKEWNLCGSLCTANDLFVKKLPVANLEIGDIFAFENTGAYCQIEGISLFLSRDLPTIVLREPDGNYTKVRERFETFELNLPQDS